MGYISDALERARERQAEEERRARASRETTPARPPALPMAPTVAAKAPVTSSAAFDEDTPALRLAEAAIASQAAAPMARPEAETAPVAAAEPALAMRRDDHYSGAWLRSVDERLVAITNPASPMSEDYRSTRTSILARHENRKGLVHMITSATPLEGKTLTTVNLGLSFAELRNRKTVILEADLRLPNFAELMALGEPAGLIGYLRQEVSLEEATTRLSDDGLAVIPAGGRAPKDAVSLLASKRMSELVGRLRTEYDHVIIDTPPVTDLADAGIIGALVDEVLVIARMRRTPRTLIEQALRTLQSYHANVGGFIATDNQPRSHGSYAYRYRYRYRDRYRYRGAYPHQKSGRRQRKAA
ncbi:MAG: CpsD/CapB family tyrosine-protein kinase [Planctomycetota bacterium]